MGREGVEPPQLSRRFYRPLDLRPPLSMDVRRDCGESPLGALSVRRRPGLSTGAAVKLLSDACPATTGSRLAMRPNERPVAYAANNVRRTAETVRPSSFARCVAARYTSSGTPDVTRGDSPVGSPRAGLPDRRMTRLAAARSYPRSASEPSLSIKSSSRGLPFLSFTGRFAKAVPPCIEGDTFVASSSYE